MAIIRTNKKSKKSSIWQRDIVELFSVGKVKKLSKREVALFCRKAAFLFNSGLPVKDAMPILASQMTSYRLNKVAGEIYKNVLVGHSFSSAVKESKAFSIFACGFIEIGEKTASLNKVCDELADMYEERANSDSELIAAMVYPISVSIMMLTVIIIAMTFVIPGYAEIFEASGVSLPALTRILINISNFFAVNRFRILIVFLTVICMSVLFLRTGFGSNFSAKVKLKIPLLKLGINFYFAQSISILLSSGLGIVDAIPLCSEVMENKHVKKDLRELSINLNSGMSFWEGIEKIKYVDELIIGLSRVGEETGTLKETMEKCKNHYEAAYKFAIRRLNKLIEPIITLILGVILAAVMLAVVLPTFELAMIV